MKKSSNFLSAMGSRLHEGLRKSIAPKANSGKSLKPKFSIEELEQRVLYSADDPLNAAIGTFDNPNSAVVRVVKAPVAIQDNQKNTAQRELVVIDERVDDIAVLQTDFQKQIDSGKLIDVVIIHHAEDGFSIISQKLLEIAERGEQVSALHVIGHGTEQQMQLGAINVTNHSIQAYSKNIQTWAGTFTLDADILLYGCDFAKSDEGKALALELAKLSQADVAASTDVTGASKLGGNWNLEFSTGDIQAAVILSTDGQFQYCGSLALITQGTETKVNTSTLNVQSTAATVNSVAIGNNGSYVVVFNDATSNDIIAQRYNATGVAQGLNFTVNTTATGSQQNATVAMDSATGDFIVAWDGSGSGDGAGIFYRRFGANGTALDATEVKANFTVTGTQSNPVISMNSVNDFYLAWVDSAQDGALNSNGVYARQFNALGAISAADVRINTTLADSQQLVSIATAAGKGVVIAWESNLQDGNLTGIYFRKFDAALSVASAETAVNTVTLGNQSRPSVDMNSAGDFVIAWQSQNVDSNGTAVVFQRYDATGTAVGANARANTAQIGNQDRSNVALADDGTFIVTWVSNGQDSVGTQGTYGQAFKANGTADGNEFLINTTVLNAQSQMSLAYNGDKAVAVWSGDGAVAGNVDIDGVFMQRFVRPNVLVTSIATTTSETGTSATFSIVLSTAPSADVLIALTSTNTAEGVVSLGSVTFTSANWNVARTVTVTGVNDFIVDGAIGYSINIAAAVSTDLKFNGIDAADLAFTNTDDDLVNTVVVNTTSDVADGNVSSIAALYANKGSDGVISLREAILAANATANAVGGADRITFNIAGGGVKTIAPTSSLPVISQAVTIDGFTQAGAAIGNLQAGTTHNLTVRLDGVSAGSLANAGLDVQANNVTIRGLNISGWAGNVNSSAIRLDTSQGALIEGNYLGTNIAGNAASPNANSGIELFNSSNAMIRNNLISGNNKAGVTLSGALTSGNVIISNLIGVNATNSAALSNAGEGVLISNAASNNRIGGTIASEANTIANNAVGVAVASGSGNAILGNSLSKNTGLAIDLGPTGVNSNDANDVDTGANDLLNFPTGITAERLGADLIVNGQVVSGLANTSFRIEIYANPATAVEASNQGEGQTFLGAITVTTDALGNALINATILGVSTTAPSGSKISLTATRSLGAGVYGSTSEFALNAIAGFKPSIQIPVSPPSAVEDTLLNISGIVAVDADVDIVSVQVSVLNGQVAVNLSGGATIAAGASGTSTFSLGGTQTQINAALATLTYQGNNGFNGTERIRVTATDLANFSDTKDLFINVAAVNDAPTISAPTSTQIAFTNVPKVFSTANLNAIQVSDTDAGLALIEITITSDAFSTVSLNGIAGLVFTSGDGSADVNMVFRGTVPDVNTALNGLTFTTSQGTLTDPSLFISVNDLGNTGSGGALLATKQLNFQAYGIEVVDTGTRVTTESGGSHVVGIRLRNAPTADVTVAIAVQPPFGPAPIEATVSSSSLTFTSSNWNVVQLVTISGADDTLNDGDKNYIVSIGPTSSTDPNYLASSTTLLSFINTDDEMPLSGGAVSISNITSTTTSEAGASTNFSIVLTSAPTSSVTINLAVSDQTEASLSTSSITFTTTNWNIAQIVTVTGLDDALADGNSPFVVVTSATISTDASYNNIVVGDVALTNLDNDVFNTVTVTTTSDVVDGDVRSLEALYKNLGIDGKISLREAILAANNTANAVGGVDHINFSISDPLINGAHTISLVAALPNIADGVFIDGQSEPDWSSISRLPVIAINGASTALGTDGLRLSGVDNNVRGIAINSFSGAAIRVLSGSFLNTFSENHLGLKTDGTTAAANAIGIQFDVGSGSGNVNRNKIAFNVNQAILINASSGVRIERNAIFSNGGLGIDLGAAGTQINDVLDADIGANGLQNFPTVTRAIAGSAAQIEGYLHSSANTTFTIDVYASTTPDSSGYGEGERWLGALTVTTDAQGYAIFSSLQTTALAALGVAEWVSTTATSNISASTSEFGFAVQSTQASLLISPPVIGNETQANTFITGTQSVAGNSQPHGATAIDTAGNSIVVWQSLGQDGDGWGIFAQRFDSSGAKVGGEFQVSSTGIGNQNNPIVAMDGAGNFVVAWTDSNIDGSANGIAIRRFSASGVALAATQLVNTNFAGDQSNAAIAMAANGDFVVSWTSNGQDGSGDGVYARAFNANGSAKSGEFRVNDATIGNQNQANIWIASDLSYRAVYSENGTIRLRSFTALGVATGASIRVDSTAVGYASSNAVIDGSNSGSFVVAWRQFGTGTNHDGAVSFQRFDSLGVAVGTINRAATGLSGNSQLRPGLSVQNTSGDFVVSWDDATRDGNESGIYAKIYDNLGVAQTSDWRVNTTSLGNQSTPHVAINDNGQMIFGWNSTPGSVDLDTGVMVQRFDRRGTTSESGTTARFMAVLDAAPVSNVTVQISSSNLREGVADISSLTFTNSNWKTPQFITVTGIDDTFIDGPQNYSIISGSVVSSDLGFNGLAAQQTRFSNADNDSSNSITVTTVADTIDGNTTSLVALFANRGADGQISFREAILAANNTANGSSADRINFNISGAGPHVFSLLSALPSVTDAVIIDGTSEPNYLAGASPVVVIDGTNAGTNSNGFWIASTANNSTIQGLIIRNFSKNGILVDAGGGLFQNNRIESNTLAGIAISSNLAQNNSVIATIFTSNGGLGIDLGTTGVNINDLTDSDIGANGLQNFPVLASATTNGSSINIAGTLTSAANTSYRIEYFRVATADVTGYGEATEFVGTINVVTNASGFVSFASNFLVSIAATDKMTATATRIIGSNTFETSEFSQNVAVLAPGITVSPTSGLVTSESGASATFAISLDAAPTSEVTINLSTSDATEGSLSVNSVTFTISNWMTPQSVTVTGLNDTFTDGNIAYSIITSNAVSADTNYNGRSVNDVSLTNTDDDTYNTIIVNTKSDVVDGDTSSIAALMSNLGADGKVSLREAIIAANATANAPGGLDQIQFNFGGTGNQIINLNSALPTITEAVLIDGQSLSGFSSSNRMVVIDGTLAGALSNGFTLASSNSQISGIFVTNFSASGIAVTSGINNFINQNIFLGNAGLSIDLGATGANANDPLDIDTGANNLQNTPIIQAASTGTLTTNISGQLRSTPNSSFRVQLFLSTLQHSSGTGEGSTFLTQIDVTTDATGLAQFSVTLPAAIAPGQFISATATLANSTFTKLFDTSEFSKAIAVIQGPVLVADSNPNPYIENSPGTPIFSNASITLADSNLIDSVTLSIVGGFQSSRDLISWTPTGTIVAIYDSNLGVLTLTGQASVAVYQNLLNSLRYSNSSDDPLTTTRLFRIETTSATFTTTTQFSLGVVAVNDPAIIVTNTPLIVAEGSSNFVSATQLTANDVDGVNRNLVYQIATGPTSGVLQRGTAVGVAVTSFTQGDIEDGLIQYIHSGNELVSDSFTFRISDGLSLTALQTFNFIITPVNDAPTLTSSQLGTTYIENGVAVRPLQTIALNDVDSVNLNGAVISLSNAEAADTFTFTNQNNISGTFNATTKVLTLTGLSSVANYQAALRSITFSSTTDLFAQTSKSVSVKVNDGSLNSNALSEQISVVNVNDTPQLAANVITTVAEGSSITISNSKLRYSDPDNAASQLTYTVLNAPINGRLELSTAPGLSISSFTQTDINNGRVNYVHSGSDTIADSFNFQVSDGAGATTVVRTFNLTITPVDDLATIQMATTPITYVENSAGIAIASSVVLTDPDTPTLTEVQVRISAGYSAGNDILLVSGTLPGSILSTWNSSTGTMTLSGLSSLANYKAAIESLRYVNSSESPDTTTRTITFGLTNSLGPQGTTSRQLDIESVNDAPIINVLANSYTVLEDNTFTFSGINKISIGDVDAQASIVRVNISVSNVGIGASISLSQVTGLSITTGTGYGNESMQFEGTLSDINAALDGLIFDPGTDFNGSNTIQISVNDRGNTGTGGVKIANRAIAMNVTAVNDPPKVSGTLSAGVNGGASLQLTTTIIQTTDVDSSTTSLTFNVINAFQHGALMLLNAPGTPTPISSFTYAQLQAGRVYYQHNNDSATLDSLNFTVSDGFADSSIATLDILISRNNVAPVLGPLNNPKIQFVEQSAAVALIPTIVVNDTDSPLLRSATISFLTGGSASADRLIFVDMTFGSNNTIRGNVDVAGNLTLSGIATVTEYQIALRSILFENTSLDPLTNDRVIEISVQDATLSSNRSTVQVGITAINNAPTIGVTAGARTLEDISFNEPGGIHVFDADIGNGLLSVTLTTAEGRMSVNSLTGIVFQNGTGINNSTMTFTGTQSQINAALDSLVFLANRDFNGTAAISVRVRDAGDSNGLNIQTSNATLQIAVDPVNDAPLLQDLSPATLSFTEGSSPITIFGAISVLDVDSVTLTSASIRISAGYIAAEDRLLVTDSRGLTVNWNSVTGTISINGNASLATYDAVIRSLQYQNISLSVTEGTRTITLEASDAVLTSATVSKSINVIAVNDAPVVSAGTLTSFTENSSSVSIFPELILSDIDSQIISGASVKISANYFASSDELSMLNTANINATWNASSATLTLTGNASISEYESALRQIHFSSSSDNLIDTTRTFVLNVTDSGGATFSTSLSGFVVTPVNDAPSLNLNANIILNEDATSAILSNPMGSLRVSDVDANQQSLTLVVTVNRGLLNIGQNIALAGASGSNTAAITLVGNLAQLSAAIEAIQFTPEADFNGTLQLAVTLEDMQGARDTKFSQIQVLAVNDAPVISTTGNEQVASAGATTAILSTISVKDIDSPLLDGAVVRVASNFSAGDRIFVLSNQQIQSSWDAGSGTLTLSGTASSLDYQSILQSLQFTTSSTNLTARTINISLKDANGATSSLNTTLGFTAPTSQTPPPTTGVGPTSTPPTSGGTTSTQPIASTTTDGAQTTGQSAANGATPGSTNAQKGLTNPQNSGLFDSSNSGASDDNLSNKEKRVKQAETGNRITTQTLSQLDTLAAKTLGGVNKEFESDFRGSLTLSRNSDVRSGDSNARLLQIANRDAVASTSGQTNALLLSLNNTEANETVQIKVSKADQLAVDLLSLPVQSGGVVVSAAVLWWITRAGGILTALLTSLPSWQHFDPLPILTSTDGQPEDDWGDENEEDDKELDAILSQ
jgi:trimeric autotransporter adhesin